MHLHYTHIVAACGCTFKKILQIITTKFILFFCGSTVALQGDTSPWEAVLPFKNI